MVKIKKRKCVYCGCDEILFMTKDHRIPKVRGGVGIENNKQDCCVACNFLKGPLTHEEFIRYKRALRILRDLNKIRIEIPLLNVRFHKEGIPISHKEGDLIK